jgi:hypothetical protein
MESKSKRKKEQKQGRREDGIKIGRRGMRKKEEGKKERMKVKWKYV